MHQPRLRVCHVIHSLGPGGAEHLLVDLAHVAAGAGMELSVVSLMPATGLEYPRRLRALGVEVHSLDLPTRWDPRGLARGLAVLGNLAPSVVHTHLKHADLVGAFAVLRLGVPLVSTLHLIEDAPSPVGRAKRWAAAQARIRTAARTIVVSDALRRWYLAAFPVDPSRVVTVRNGVLAPPPVGEEAQRALRASLGVPPGCVMATMVGIMRPGKGHADLIAAAARVPEGLDVRFVLAGDGPLRRRLEAAARTDPRAAKRVVFAGFRTDVAELLAASDLIVHPSRFDALPTALIHGLAAGLPVVASDVGGIPEVVTPDAGRLVPPGDVRALADAVVALAGDPAARQHLGAAARRRFAAEFDAAAWARRLREVYAEAAKELAAGASPGPGAPPGRSAT